MEKIAIFDRFLTISWKRLVTSYYGTLIGSRMFCFESKPFPMTLSDLESLIQHRERVMLYKYLSTENALQSKYLEKCCACRSINHLK